MIDDRILQVVACMERYPSIAWRSAPELAIKLKWEDGKTRYWLEKMVDIRYAIWRWHPGRHGWHATKQYALPHLAKRK